VFLELVIAKALALLYRGDVVLCLEGRVDGVVEESKSDDGRWESDGAESLRRDRRSALYAEGRR